MINWNDVLRESENRAATQALNNLPLEMNLRRAIYAVGSPQNETASNEIESTVEYTYNEDGTTASSVTILRADVTTIDDGFLAR